MSLVSKAYLEDYHYIKLIIHQGEMGMIDIDELYLYNENINIKLSVFKIEQFGDCFHLNTTFKGRIHINQDYYLKFSNGESLHLDLGKIMRTVRFDVENYYDGPLGVSYSKEASIFRIWSPVAKEINLMISNSDEQLMFALTYTKKGLWETKLEGDYEGYTYYYEVRINEEFFKCLDPYAISSNANSQANYVIDPTKLYKYKYSTPYFSGCYTDAVLYELHLRDVNYDNMDKSCYLGLLNHQIINHYRELGITHLQIMPVNAFGGVNEQSKELLYNWGYNPLEYNVPSGWYATNPNDPYNRLNELKQMIDGLHQQGLLVNLDVVYNHVYNDKEFAYNVLVPGYVYRTDQEGFMTNGSGCGNDLASERSMIRRMIIDSLAYWTAEYKVDGFRFDLMGLIDYETLQMAEKELRKINPSIMLYGEGWNLSTGLSENLRATINNFWALPNFAYFNDAFRNHLRGELHSQELGFVMGKTTDYEDIIQLIKGSSSNEYLFNRTTQSINYVECHDNLTFYDQMIKCLGPISEEEAINRTILSIGMVILSEGIPFIQAGQELMRTKKGIDNSYNADLSINGVSYADFNKYQKIIMAIKSLIKIRKEYYSFRLKKSDVIDEIMSFSICHQKTLTCELQTNDTKLLLIFKNQAFMEQYNFNDALLVFDGRKIVKEKISVLEITHPGIYIIDLLKKW